MQLVMRAPLLAGVLVWAATACASKDDLFGASGSGGAQGGGAAPLGGTMASGSGGLTSSGGTATSGGATNSGGATDSAGAGANSSGGALHAGGTSSTGGSPAKGGGGGAGATSGSGGIPSEGGATGGGGPTGGTAGASGAAGTGGRSGSCPVGQIWCPGCTVGTGICSTGGCPASACSSCSLVTTLTECEARTDCHSVFVDPGTCGCAAVGCCARFSFCADGELASCSPAQLGCTTQTPFCERPAYVVSYAGSCFEGCVLPKDCAQ